jgi:hypothetical protein
MDKILTLWIAICLDKTGAEDVANAQPTIPLSCSSISALMKALTM